jgi:hypothetical protein
MTLDRTVVTITLDTIVAFGDIVAFIILLVALLTSSPVMWRKEHIWNFSVLHRQCHSEKYVGNKNKCTDIA